MNTLLAVAIAGTVGTVSMAHGMESTSAGSSYNSEMTTTEYYAMKKLEAQKKSTEMRKKKVEEMKAKGIDVS
jgi:hypothetical protein